MSSKEIFETGIKVMGTDFMEIPTGNSAQRTLTPGQGSIRCNEETGDFEWFLNGTWNQPAKGTATAGAVAANFEAEVSTLYPVILQNKTDVAIDLPPAPKANDVVYFYDRDNKCGASITGEGVVILNPNGKKINYGSKSRTINARGFFVGLRYINNVRGWTFEIAPSESYNYIELADTDYTVLGAGYWLYDETDPRLQQSTNVSFKCNNADLSLGDEIIVTVASSFAIRNAYWSFNEVPSTPRLASSKLHLMPGAYVFKIVNDNNTLDFKSGPWETLTSPPMSNSLFTEFAYFTGYSLYRAVLGSMSDAYGVEDYYRLALNLTGPGIVRTQYIENQSLGDIGMYEAVFKSSAGRGEARVTYDADQSNKRWYTDRDITIDCSMNTVYTAMPCSKKQEFDVVSKDGCTIQIDGEDSKWLDGDLISVNVRPWVENVVNINFTNSMALNVEADKGAASPFEQITEGTISVPGIYLMKFENGAWYEVGFTAK